MMDYRHIGSHLARSAERATFWYGWFCGAATASGFLLVVRLIWAWL